MKVSVIVNYVQKGHFLRPKVHPLVRHVVQDKLSTSCRVFAFRALLANTTMQLEQLNVSHAKLENLERQMVCQVATIAVLDNILLTKVISFVNFVKLVCMLVLLVLSFVKSARLGNSTQPKVLLLVRSAHKGRSRFQQQHILNVNCV